MNTLLLLSACSTLCLSQAPEQTLQTPAELRIQQALAAIERAPDRVQNFCDLALGFARRARETADPSFYERGEKALKVAMALDPTDLAAKKARAWILLGEHRFEEARVLAAELNAQIPDDVLVYGFLADACTELGDYEAAESAVQWMLDLRPGNVPALTRAAYLRELFGDIEGALELFVDAYHRTDPVEVEDRAWILTQLGHLELARGKTAEAEKLLEQALALFPDYHYALAKLAEACSEQGDLVRATELLRRRHELAPHPENLFDLAVVLERAGRADEARQLFRRFEREALAESQGPDNANRELVAYYTEFSDDPAAETKALALAQRERERRADVHTRECLAAALLSNGQPAQARKEIEAGLAVGVREARMLARAGSITAACGDFSAAREYLAEAQGLRPRLACVTRSAEALERLESSADSPDAPAR